MSSSTDVLTHGSLHENGSVSRTPTRRLNKSCSSPGIPAQDITGEYLGGGGGGGVPGYPPRILPVSTWGVLCGICLNN